MAVVQNQESADAQTSDSTVDSAGRAISDARALVGEFFVPQPTWYWIDLLSTLTLGYSMAGVYLSSPLFSSWQLISFTICGFALFRAASFIHEITHMRGGQMLGFRVGWNLLCGIPMVMPSHFYENHSDHHNSHHYGTTRDGE